MPPWSRHLPGTKRHAEELSPVSSALRALLCGDENAAVRRGSALPSAAVSVDGPYTQLRLLLTASPGEARALPFCDKDIEEAKIFNHLLRATQLLNFTSSTDVLGSACTGGRSGARPSAGSSVRHIDWPHLPRFKCPLFGAFARCLPFPFPQWTPLGGELPWWDGGGEADRCLYVRGFAAELLGSKGYILPRGRSGFALGSSCLCPAR